jgi:hypothetical protein
MAMKKIALLSFIFLVSLNTLTKASSITDLNPAILNSTLQHINAMNQPNSLPIIYGGKDISRQRVAATEKTIWAGEPNLVG